MLQTLSQSSVCGPPNNLDYLQSILKSTDFESGFTLTSFLSSFSYTPPAIDVIKAGAYTLVQDYPGRPAIGKGIPHSGPMVGIHLLSREYLMLITCRILWPSKVRLLHLFDGFLLTLLGVANFVAGNPGGMEGLEIALDGPRLLFINAAVVALCGAPFEASLDGKPFPMWTRVQISPGQELSIGKTTGNGCRGILHRVGGIQESKMLTDCSLSCCSWWLPNNSQILQFKIDVAHGWNRRVSRPSTRSR
jgi:hypothetical protein